jgi:hypothetical protein
MGDGNFYLIGGCSGWTILLFLAVLQLFLAVSLFPASVEILSRSLAVRGARSDVEDAAKKLDSHYQFSVSVLNDIYANNIPSILNYQRLINVDQFYAAQYQYDAAQARWINTFRSTSKYAFSFASSTSTTLLSYIQVKAIPTSVENPLDNGYIAKSVNYYLNPTSSFSLSNDFSSRIVASTIEPVLIGSVDFTLSQNYSFPITSLNEQLVSSLIYPGLRRGEIFASFLIFQTLFALILFVYLIRALLKNSSPSKAPIISGIGWILFVVGWVFGYTSNNYFDINYELDNYIQSSWLQDIFGIIIYNNLNGLWIALFTYSLYANNQGYLDK